MRRIRSWLALPALILAPLILAPLILAPLILAPWSAPAGAQTLDEIASTVDETGRYLERDLRDVAVVAVERANGQGVAFVYLDQENGDDLRIIATELLDRLEAAGSAYRSLIVLDTSGVYVVSAESDAAAAAADAALPEFARGAVAAGIDTVVAVIGGSAPTEADGSADSTDSTDSGSGGGVPWLLILVLAVIAFLVVRFVIGQRRRRAALEAELAEDRAEIREQLRDNADHVIELGDRIADADDELRRLYEEAAQTYQDVSLGLDDATTAAEIDALDDRLDRAEWQFEVIDARLAGRTPPSEPGMRPRPGDRQPVPPLGDDDLSRRARHRRSQSGGSSSGLGRGLLRR